MDFSSLSLRESIRDEDPLETLTTMQANNLTNLKLL